MKVLEKKYNGILLMLCLFILLFAVGSPAQEDDDAAYDALIESGKKAYEVRCLLCHGSNGDGNGPVGIIRRVEKTGGFSRLLPEISLWLSSGSVPLQQDVSPMMKTSLP